MTINVQYGDRSIEICEPYDFDHDTENVILDIHKGAYLEGSDRYTTPLEDFFAKKGVGVWVVHQENATRWLRDIVVQRPDGTVLVPYGLEEDITMVKVNELSSYLFHRMNQGWSFISGSFDQLSITYEKKVEEIQTSIDGGNVIFWKVKERRGAFVGLSVVFATLCALIQSGAVNTDRHQYIENEELTYGERIFLLGSYRQRMQFFAKNEACYNEYKQLWQHVFITIAKNLGIAQEDLIILPHSALHIDLHVLVAPDSRQGKVYLHDPCKTIAKLKELQSIFSEYNENLTYFEKEIEAQYHEMSLGIFEKNKEILEGEGFIVEGIMGRIDTLLPQTGYFINGLMCTNQLNEHFYLTGPLTQTCIHKNQIIKNGSSLLGFWEECLFIDEMVRPLMRDGITVIFIDYFGATGGGLHCLTNEYRIREARQFPSQSIPVDSRYFPSTIPTQIEVITNIADLAITIRDIRDLQDTIKKNTLTQCISEQWGETHIFIFTLPVPLQGLHYSWNTDINVFDGYQKLFPGHHQKRKFIQTPQLFFEGVFNWNSEIFEQEMLA